MTADQEFWVRTALKSLIGGCLGFCWFVLIQAGASDGVKMPRPVLVAPTTTTTTTIPNDDEFVPPPTKRETPVEAPTSGADGGWDIATVPTVIVTPGLPNDPEPPAPKPVGTFEALLGIIGEPGANLGEQLDTLIIDLVTTAP